MTKQEHAPFRSSQLFETTSGTCAQKVIKRYLKPSNPQGTLDYLEKFQVRSFRQKVRTFGDIVSGRYKKTSRLTNETNYNLGRLDLDGLLNHISYAIFFNEVVHWGVAILSVPGAYIALLKEPTWAYQQPGSSLLFFSVMFLNTHILMTQRYNRAEIVLLIDRLRARFPNSPRLKIKRYKNRFALEIPDDWYAENHPNVKA